MYLRNTRGVNILLPEFSKLRSRERVLWMRIPHIRNDVYCERSGKLEYHPGSSISSIGGVHSYRPLRNHAAT